jgi:2-polyprenyl-3-methyl-5-hydroxy-6-metoxy-1,4-benzoquinol methylase
VPCQICGYPAREQVIGGNALLVCARCGAGRLAEGAIRNDYWEDPNELLHNDAFWLEARREYFGAALKLLGAMAPGRRLLDFGGGLGFFAAMARDQNWDAYSFDISQEATRRAQVMVGTDRAVQSLSELGAVKFDVVTAWCVIAHASDPLVVLRNIRSVLAPDGIAWITTPNFGFQRFAASLRQYLGRPADFAREDHIFHFTAAALRILLDNVGLCDLRFRYAGTTRICLAAGGREGLFAITKRAWNVGAFALGRLGFPLATSELQVTCVRCRADEGEFD